MQLGCVVRGDTPHFDYVCAGTTQGIAQLNAEGDIPVIYGLITTNTMQQAEDRAGGKLGNKGDECAITAIKMLDFKQKVQGKQIFWKKVLVEFAYSKKRRTFASQLRNKPTQ